VIIMGMDYIPVFEDEDDGGSTAKIQRLGARAESAEMRELRRTVHAVGTVRVNDRKLTGCWSVI
jgi:membrane fusion protein, copper/silver efflux system